jgi:hypothetical protein
VSVACVSCRITPTGETCSPAKRSTKQPWAFNTTPAPTTSHLRTSTSPPALRETYPLGQRSLGQARATGRIQNLALHSSYVLHRTSRRTTNRSVCHVRRSAIGRGFRGDSVSVSRRGHRSPPVGVRTPPVRSSLRATSSRGYRPRGPDVRSGCSRDRGDGVQCWSIPSICHQLVVRVRWLGPVSDDAVRRALKALNPKSRAASKMRGAHRAALKLAATTAVTVPVPRCSCHGSGVVGVIKLPAHRW